MTGDLHRGFLWATLVGVIAGFGAVIFRNLISLFGRLFFDYGEKLLSALGPYAVILIPAAGGLLVGPLIYFFAREAKGHADVERAMIEGLKDATAGDIATKSLVTAYPDQTLREVLLKLGAIEVGRIPVVDRQKPRRLLGVLRRQRHYPCLYPGDGEEVIGLRIENDRLNWPARISRDRQQK